MIFGSIKKRSHGKSMLINNYLNLKISTSNYVKICKSGNARLTTFSKLQWMNCNSMIKSSPQARISANICMLFRDYLRVSPDRGTNEGFM